MRSVSGGTPMMALPMKASITDRVNSPLSAPEGVQLTFLLVFSKVRSKIGPRLL